MSSVPGDAELALGWSMRWPVGRGARCGNGRVRVRWVRSRNAWTLSGTQFRGKEKGTLWRSRLLGCVVGSLGVLRRCFTECVAGRQRLEAECACLGVGARLA